MNAWVRSLTAVVMLSVGYGASAEQGGQVPAQPLSKRQIEQQHEMALKKCDALKDNAKKICEAEADGQKSVAEAQVRVMERNSPKNRLRLAEVRADAEFEVAKARCDDQVGEAKEACRRNAKATRDKARAQGKRDSQTNTQSPGSAGSDFGSGPAYQGAGAGRSSAPLPPSGAQPAQ